MKAPTEMSDILKREAPAYQTGKENHYAAPVHRNPIMQAYEPVKQAAPLRPETVPMSDIDRKIMEKEKELAAIEKKMVV